MYSSGILWVCPNTHSNALKHLSVHLHDDRPSVSQVCIMPSHIYMICPNAALKQTSELGVTYNSSQSSASFQALVSQSNSLTLSIYLYLKVCRVL